MRRRRRGGENAGGGEPIRIGALTSLTGNFTPWGVQVRDGMQLAVNEINQRGGVDGRRLELVVADDQSQAEEGTRAIERLSEREGVVAVGGIISSDVGLATARIAEQSKVPLFLVKAGAGGILNSGSRYTFRTCLPAAPMVAGPVLQYVQSKNLTRVGAIVADYAWGQAIKAALEDTFAAAPDIKLQIEVAPVGEQDFTTYLRSLERLDPQMIVATGHPPGSGAITVQSADLGFDVPITGAYTPRSLVMGGAKNAAIDRYADFGCADYQSKEYQDLARASCSSPRTTSSSRTMPWPATGSSPWSPGRSARWATIPPPSPSTSTRTPSTSPATPSSCAGRSGESWPTPGSPSTCWAPARARTG
jgi:branched-chain amino acid transport system substrate-binding protein